MHAEIGKKYRHYKNGMEYEVIALAHHSETLEEMVVYKALYESEFGTDAVWVRPRRMFEEELIHEGNIVQRFALVESGNSI